MSRRLIGTLTDPSGTPLAGWTLAIDALRNLTPSVPIGARESVVLDAAGAYDVVVDDGLYMALLYFPGSPNPRRLGSLLVEPGSDIDILTLIELYSPPGSSGTVGLSLAVADEGVQLTGSAASLKFTGAGVTATAVGGAVTVDVPDGGAWGEITGTLTDQTDLQAALDLKQSTNEKGAANGYASLDAGGTVPDAQIPAAITRDSELEAHTNNTSNPHSVTKIQLGLGSVDNTADTAKPVSTAQQAALNLKQSTSAKGAPNGYASLDGAGEVPDAQLGPIGDTTPSRGTFTDVRIVQTAPTIAAGVLTLNLALSNVFTVPLNQNITSIVVSNVAPAGRMSSFQLMFTADGTARTVAYMAGIVWPSEVAPTLTSTLNKRDWLQFETFDGGTTWFGFVIGKNF